MASHGKITDINDDKVRLDAGWRTWGFGLIVVGVLALIGALGYSGVAGIRHFYFSYFHSFIFYLSLTLGCMFFVLIQHLVRAGWSVTVRRIAEIFSMNFIVLTVLFLPVVYSVYQDKGLLYPWAQAGMVHHEGGHGAEATEPAEHGAEHAEHAKEAASTEGQEAKVAQHGQEGQGGTFAQTHQAPQAGLIHTAPGKADENFVPSGVLNTFAHNLSHIVEGKSILRQGAFYIAAVIFFGSWLLMATYYYKTSKKQDETGDINLTLRMQWWAPVSTFVLAMTLTAFAWFFIMTLSPVFFSTMFGVYYFAGCMGASFALLILTFHFLTSKGYVKHITSEHFQDMGKFLFGFTVFWAYISYSQYMLIWYANIPEESFWFRLRGATTASGAQTSWGTIAILLVVCRFAIPFLGLLSRHVKRAKYGLIFWAVWILAFHFIDLYWAVMPELFENIRFGLMEVLTFVGMGGVWFGYAIVTATSGNLTAVKDPRLPEALAFENM